MTASSWKRKAARPGFAVASGLAVAVALAAAGCGSAASTAPASTAPARTAAVAGSLAGAGGHGRVGPITVTGAYIPQPASPSMAAAMLVIHNSGPADRLVSVTAPGFGDVSLHATRTTPDGGERMVAVGRPLTVPANGTLSLQPDGYHVMLMQPAEPLRRGGAVSMTLTFARAGALHLTVPVVAMTGLPGMGESN